MAYARGFTGLGVGATRFGANVMLDLLDGQETERTRLEMVRTKPLPFPPEPFASIGVELTRWSLAVADRNEGRRNVWLRSLDGMGLGFRLVISTPTKPLACSAPLPSSRFRGDPEMIRRDVAIALVEVSPAEVRAAVDAHQLSLDWSGDSFMADHWLAGEHRAVVVDGAPVGVTGWGEAGLTLLLLAPQARRHDRQVTELVLRESGARTAYVASWDAHHLAVLGAFATGIASQAYQFRLGDADDLRQPLPGLTLALATHTDLGYLESTGWQDDVASFVERNAMSVVRLDGQEVGIAVHEPHALDPAVVDIGMYVDPVLRRRGVGSSILALTAREVLAQGRTPVAGCRWKNWPSRVTLEAAGLTCAGTIFRLDLDPDLFATAG